MIVQRCCFGVVLLLAGVWCQAALAALTGEYLFESSTAADTSGNMRDGTLEGGPTFTTGLYKNSSFALLNGDNQSVLLPPNTDFIRNAPGATLLAWVRPDNLGATRNIVVVNNADATATGGIGNARALLEFDPANGLRALGRQNDTGGSSTAGGFTPVVGRTYFVAGVFDYVGNAIRLYVDGEQVAQNLSPGWGMNSADTANLAARIASHANGTQQWWNGALDGVRIYNEALSATAIFDTFLAEVLSPPGDTDGDGTVELEDLTPIRTHYRQTVATKGEGDLTGDLVVDFRDFREWKTWYLQTIGEGSLSGVNLSFLSAPEPSTVWLTLVGIGGLVGARSRRRSNP